ncbi:MAG: hypothetical protein Q7J08_01080 [Methanocorpusculum sp.]|uniref:hypothetical protein n=1 Tax=Methanocorpusculum sp. TaxID=2058474 RepID=UPI0027283C4E|nr:hypothetical protein [Methanocorpusculum sp.]MDO9522288.1 hypothetical protein [Methanocorpusculum sp.]
MGDVLKTIAEKTNGERYQSKKYSHDARPRAGIEYDVGDPIFWKQSGETEKHTTSINLKNMADGIAINNEPSIFKYFLDGSRRTYKVDDISYDNKVYPIIAGQIGIGCCVRNNKRLKKEEFWRRLVIVLPEAASNDSWGPENFFNEVLGEVNKSPKMMVLKGKFNIQFDNILYYRWEKDVKLEDKAIASVQMKMLDLEKDLVAELVEKNKLHQDSYLIKDGSLEYKMVKSGGKNGRNDLTSQKIRNNYRYVVGVSKSFDPTKAQTKSGTNSDVIAKLKPFERTPAFLYSSEMSGASFIIWYLRLHDSKYTDNVFDGVVKVEMVVLGSDEEVKPKDSDEIDIISAHLLNERNPVCYGKDDRWANHIYPIYLTESFVKSKYLSADLFMELF